MGKTQPLLKPILMTADVNVSVCEHVPLEVKGVGSPGTGGVPGICELSNMDAREPKSGPLEKQYLFLTPIPSLWFYNLKFVC